MFANRYLERNNKEALIDAEPSSRLGIIVVIPCFREPDIIKTLESLKQCELPEQHVEVIILINHSQVENDEIKNHNRQTKADVEQWNKKNNTTELKFFAVGPIELKKKWAGAGLARKSGMDEAVLRFNRLEKPNGIIISLDADTLVKPNYFTSIENHFRKHRKNVGATISFEHLQKGLEKKHREGIQLYEKYQLYYKEALRFAGYPHSMFTVGSAFAVTAEAYVKRGGMNRRQAGEDFYFLQNLAQLGPIGEIAETKVYPSARLSDRVPFGTGPVLQKWLTGEQDLSVTFNFRAFEDLKEFFDKKDLLFLKSKGEYLQEISVLPLSIKEFLIQSDFWKELDDLNRNCSSLKSFRTRFFQKFNAFKILKFLNFAHDEFCQKADLQEQLQLLNKKSSCL